RLQQGQSHEREPEAEGRQEQGAPRERVDRGRGARIHRAEHVDRQRVLPPDQEEGADEFVERQQERERRSADDPGPDEREGDVPEHPPLAGPEVLRGFSRLPRRTEKLVSKTMNTTGNDQSRCPATTVQPENVTPRTRRMTESASPWMTPGTNIGKTTKTKKPTWAFAA